MTDPEGGDGTRLVRLAEDVAVLVRDGAAVLLRDGVEVLHLPGAGPAAEWLAGWSGRPWRPAELAGTPAPVRHLLALLERHGAVVADPLTGHLLELHGRTVGGRLDLPAGPGVDGSFLARESGTGPIVRLPPAVPGSSTTLAEALRNRRSAGRFGTGPLPLEVLGSMLGAAAGADTWAVSEDRLGAGIGDGDEGGGGSPGPAGGTGRRGSAGPARPYPSGGGCYPVETHVVAVRVAGLRAAGYRYLPLAHALSRRAAATPATEPARWLPSLPPGETAVVVLLTVDFARPALARYGGKAYRLALLEAGHLAQNLLLLGTALGVAGRPYCGYDDEAAAGAVGLAYPTETVLYALAIGPVPDERRS